MFCFVDTTHVYLVDVDIVDNYIIIISRVYITEMEISLYSYITGIKQEYSK